MKPIIPVLNFKKRYILETIKKLSFANYSKIIYFPTYMYLYQMVSFLFYFLVKLMTQLLNYCHLSNELCVFLTKPYLVGAYSAGQLG